MLAEKLESFYLQPEVSPASLRRSDPSSLLHRKWTLTPAAGFNQRTAAASFHSSFSLRHRSRTAAERKSSDG